MENFWSLTTEDALHHLSCSEQGLASDIAENRLKSNGPNTLRSHSGSSGIVLFLLQFKSPITILLIISALLSVGLGDATDAVIILIIIIISSVLSFWQEKGAAHAVDELLKMVQVYCNVLRDGKNTEVPIENVVPGDIIMLSAGDIIPGDCLLLEAHELFIDEAAFTGETYPAEKNTGIVKADAPISQRYNSLFMGTHVISGIARALVITTGKQTEFGKISDNLQLKPPETDFEKGIRRFGYLLMEVTLLLVLIIFAVNVLLHKPPLDSFLFSLALAIGLTPQLLPAIITINLSTGARNMAKEGVIVKRLSSIENFGSMNILCSDKTGTITEGKVTLKEALNIEGEHSDKVLELAWLNASMQRGYYNPIDDAICAACKATVNKYKLQCEIPYDFIRKRLTVQVYDADENFVVIKGALNNILEICDKAETPTGSLIAIEEIRDKILEQYQQQSAYGYRTLGIAYKKASSTIDFTRDDEHEMIFMGIVTLFDPPKNDIAQTITSLNKLGVELKLITGDNALVAASIARQVGMTDPVVVTGPQMRQMSDAALMQQVQNTNIFAEVEPNQKEKIIIFLKKGGNVLGFMGDGINDATALHAADVGISVDSAVDVAKEAADIVLLKHDLNVLCNGVVAGRKTFANTMKYIFMSTSANFGNMFSMAGASLFLPFLPLLPKQILLTNLLTDFPEMTIATDRVDDESIKTPHKWDISFIQRFMLIFGLLSSVFDYLTFGVLLYIVKGGTSIFQTGWFVESVISATFIVLVVRTRLPFFKSIPGVYLQIATGLIVAATLAIPYSPLAGLFGFVPLPLVYYCWMVPIVTFYIISAEIAKRLFYKRLANPEKHTRKAY